MRVNLSRALALVIVVGLALPAAAQEEPIVVQGAVETSLSGGAGFPLGDFKDNANTGFNIGARAGYYVSDRIAIGGQGAYERYGASDELKQLLADKEDALEELQGGIDKLDHPAIQVLRTEIVELQGKLANAEAQNLERQLAETREQERIADLQQRLDAAIEEGKIAKEDAARTQFRIEEILAQKAVCN